MHCVMSRITITNQNIGTRPIKNRCRSFNFRIRDSLTRFATGKDQLFYAHDAAKLLNFKCSNSTQHSIWPPLEDHTDMVCKHASNLLLIIIELLKYIFNFRISYKERKNISTVDQKRTDPTLKK